jgi:SAM-dependent methyltransferase
MDLDADAIQTLVEAGYDELTDRFQSPFIENFENKPLERRLFESFGDLVGDRPVLDAGCGHGPVSRFLHQQGFNVRGIDLSAPTVERARVLNPHIEFEQMNLLETSFADGSFGGIASFYSLVHMKLSEVRTALGEFRRLLGSPGILLIAVYRGEGERLLKMGEGYAVEMYSKLFEVDELRQLLEDGGFRVLELVTRPHEKVEIRHDRIFALARHDA